MTGGEWVTCWAIGAVVTLVLIGGAVLANRAAGRGPEGSRVRLSLSFVAASLGWPIFWPWTFFYLGRSGGAS